ncbi:MAG: AmmeMemoRadiSam system protein B [Dehalococcoidia bacterium]|nr:AmmeMemoRadiSam system protein B [Dehalococcoidia bacterium]MQG15338.1 AmmeMemoRadiSam system protein B [SAR202 cluster bacterium]|tara:strand:+ start:9180 stop:10424 length:1245 start_codon:yes stop_codon:yes gene_type:complete
MSDNNFKLRSSLDPKWVEHQGKDFLYLQDPLMLSDKSILIPAPIVPLLRMLDGTKNVNELREAIQTTVGLEFSNQKIQDLLDQLDRAFLLENSNLKDIVVKTTEQYRKTPNRLMMHSGTVYPEDKSKTIEMISGFCEQNVITSPSTDTGSLVGLLSPHIDFARGGGTYASTWQAAAPSLQDIESVIIFGTDHYGGSSTITPTLQNYATPFGILNTDIGVVEKLIDKLDAETILVEELHHRSEHSIELASVWMHAFMASSSFSTIPILCGSFYKYIENDEQPDNNPIIGETINILAESIRQRRTLIVAAGDLAHVGPVFGDSTEVIPASRHTLQLHDDESIAAICDGDGDLFLSISRLELDKRRICGLSPIYMMLKTIECAYNKPAKGFAMGYDQCPADVNGGSLVSITGALLYV